MKERATFRRNSAAGYAAAVIITTAAVGVRLAVFDLFQGFPFVTLFPAVVLATGGVGKGRTWVRGPAEGGAGRARAARG